MENSRTVRVAIVDDVQATREGCEGMLARHADIEVVSTLDFPEALARAHWADVDVVLLDAGELKNPRDNIPGAMVAQRIRRLHPRLRPGDAPTIIVVTGYASQEAVLLRMSDAGADYIVDRTRATTRDEDLHSVVLGPSDLASPEPPPGFRHELGVRPSVNSNDLVTALDEVAERFGIGPDNLDPAAPVRLHEPDRSVWTRVKGVLDGFVDPRDSKGRPMTNAVSPQKIQIRSIWKRLTRLPPA